MQKFYNYKFILILKYEYLIKKNQIIIKFFYK